MPDASTPEQINQIVHSFVDAQLRRGVLSSVIRQALVNKGVNRDVAQAIVSRIASTVPQGNAAGYWVNDKRNFREIIIDIVGGCNAKCFWCTTGKTGGKGTKRFVDVNTFARAIDRLMEMGAILPRQLVALYNWGEPMLHPDFNGIARVLIERELWFGVSTNVSIPPKPIDPACLARMAVLKISMPGFSQSSYDKVHGFDFEKILQNIDSWFHILEKTGYPKQRMVVVFFVYQFNLPEIQVAQNYFQDKYGIKISLSTPYLNDMQMSIDYMTGKMGPELLRKASQELFLHYVDELVATQPDNWNCPQIEHALVLNEACDVVLCCGVSPEHEECRLGSVFDMSLEEIREKKSTRKICRECIGSGALYWMAHPPSAKKMLGLE